MRHQTLGWALRLLPVLALLHLAACAAAGPAADDSHAQGGESDTHMDSERGGEPHPHLQSPIDLPAELLASTSTHTIALRYHETMEHLIHRDHTIELEYDSGSVIEFDGRSFELDQLHFHTPAEHLIAHRRFPVEMHLVHHASDGSLLVLGVLFEVGAPNAFIQRILDDAPRDIGRIEHDRGVNVSDLILDQTHFYAYPGSLTTPPFTEGVQWLILRDQPSVSADQVVQLLLLEGGNARDVQPLNDRSIEGD